MRHGYSYSSWRTPTLPDLTSCPAIPSGQEVNGGVLNVAKGGYAWFGMNVLMADVTVHSVPDEGSDVTSDRWYGGCIYNQVRDCCCS